MIVISDATPLHYLILIGDPQHPLLQLPSAEEEQ
jgi:hypothetical protein